MYPRLDGPCTVAFSVTTDCHSLPPGLHLIHRRAAAPALPCQMKAFLQASPIDASAFTLFVDENVDAVDHAGRSLCTASAASFIFAEGHSVEERLNFSRWQREHAA